MSQSKRTYKDGLFVNLFGKCKEAKQNFLSLYNAIHDTDFKLDEVDIEPVTLKNVVYKGVKNDVSMKINNCIVVLAEQQSTVNYNMPFRCLEYVVAQYTRLFPKDDKYRRTKIYFPRPEFYVFYNGIEPFPDETELFLSDSFKHIQGNESLNAAVNLELKVRVFNINEKQNHPLLAKCFALFAYTKFNEYVRIAKQQDEEDCVGYAIRRCISENLLADYFERLSREDRGMIFGEYSYEDDVRVQREEAQAIGEERGSRAKALETARNLLAMNLGTHEQIAAGTGLSLTEIQQLAAEK